MDEDLVYMLTSYWEETNLAVKAVLVEALQETRKELLASGKRGNAMSETSARQVILASSDVSSGRSPRKVRERREKEKPVRQVLLAEPSLTDEEEERRSSKDRPRLLPPQAAAGGELADAPSVGPASLVPAPLAQAAGALAGQRSSGPPALVAAPAVPPPGVKGGGKPEGASDQPVQSSAPGGGSAAVRPGIGGNSLYAGSRAWRRCHEECRACVAWKGAGLEAHAPE